MSPARISPTAFNVGRIEMMCFGAAGVSALAPLCMVFPSNQARLGRQTARWGPTWERNINYFAHPLERGITRVAPPLERGIQRVAPPLERAVKAVDAALPLERIAKIGERTVRSTLEHFVTPS